MREPREGAPPNVCSEKGCGRKLVARGLCGKHYQRAMKIGCPPPRRFLPATGECKVESCKSAVKAKGYCKQHYQKYRVRRHHCSVADCGRGVDANGMCAFHYQRHRKYGDPLACKTAEVGAGLDFLRSLVGHKGDECVSWPFGMEAKGYGASYFDGKPTRANHVMCILAHGPRPKGAMCRHTCGGGTKGCVNPNHLVWGTSKENVHDMFEHGVFVLGEAHSKAKLTEAQVLAILADPRSSHEVSLDYDVTSRSIREIRQGRRWSWLTKRYTKDREHLREAHERMKK